MADTVKKSTAADIINTIRDNLPKVYAERIPKATQDNIAKVGEAITTDTIVMNEFMSALINKVAFTKVCNKAMFDNPFAPFKAADVPLGANIEEIYVNPAIDTGYLSDGNLLLKTTKPDGKVCYYGMNRQGRYTVSIMEPKLQRAFTNESTFMELVNVIVSTLYSGDSIDELHLCKNTLGAALDNNAILVLDGDIDNPKEIIKSIANISKDFTFDRTQYCGYNRVNGLPSTTTGAEKPCITWCPKSDQYIVMTSDMETEIDFEYLAGVYQLSKTELALKTIIVDDIPSEDYKIYAMLMDKTALQFRDAVNKIKKFENGSNLVDSWFYHHWQYFYVSMFANIVAFGKKKATTGGSSGGGGTTETPGGTG